MAPRQLVVNAMTRLGPNTTHEMIMTSLYQIYKAGYLIDEDDVVPFTCAAEARRLGTSKEDLEAAATLLSFTRTEQAVNVEMIRGIKELQQAMVRRIIEEDEAAGH